MPAQDRAVYGYTVRLHRFDSAKDITFVTTSELEEMFPDNTPKEREYYFAKAKVQSV
mgnify:CR=1 FL=1